jgi:hypothetical protein
MVEEEAAGVDVSCPLESAGDRTVGWEREVNESTADVAGEGVRAEAVVGVVG